MSDTTPDRFDKLILKELQGDLGTDPEPYRRIAETVGLDQDDVLERIARMKDAGIIRRLGAMIRHIEAGIDFNAMVVWKVDPHRTEEVGSVLAAFPEVTHCYERPPFGKNRGTLFTMVHAEAREQCLDAVERMAERVGIDEYEILFSKRELKKISMSYYSDEGPDGDEDS